MRKFLFITALMVAFLSVNAMAQVNFGLKSLGVHLGFVMPESPVDNTVGFGIQSEFGSFKINQASFTFGAFINYWSKSYGDPNIAENTFSKLTIAPFVQYNLPMESSFHPYVGGGLGLARNGSEINYKNNYLGLGNYSSSSTDVVLFGLAGAKMSLTDQLEGFAEARYQLGNINDLGIYVGVNYLLSK